ncbi:MAG: hypothetical protein JKY53_01285 [Flavobacteriales bacterium]|nr:hypothetical protein [Flavobacteriales bacterium]
MSWNFLEKTGKVKLKHSFSDSVKMINTEHWTAVVKEKNIYFSLPYLQALEDALRGSLNFRYIVFYSEEYKPVGIAVVQILDFIDNKEKYNDALCVVGTKIKHKLLGHIDIKVMVCGNVFATGENGFLYSDEIDPEDAYINLSNALYRLRRSERINGQVSIILLKEFWPTSYKKVDVLKVHEFRSFNIDVNMVLKIHESWHSMNDYLDSMISKFRTKAKSVYKRSADLVVEEMSAPEIEENLTKVEDLYESVVEQAEFRFGELNGQSFVNFKKRLGDKFIFKGYFLEDKLVGFSSAFVSPNFIDANYVGLDYSINHDYSLYQRMLYDYTELAINNGVKELRLGRTAEEIKSCIGAEPIDMKLYVKHRNSVSNKLIKPIIESISPSKFELRKPFKVSFAS